MWNHIFIIQNCTIINREFSNLQFTRVYPIRINCVRYGILTKYVPKLFCCVLLPILSEIFLHHGSQLQRPDRRYVRTDVLREAVTSIILFPALHDTWNMNLITEIWVANFNIQNQRYCQGNLNQWHKVTNIGKPGTGKMYELFWD